MHLHHCRCFQKHMEMLLQSLRALCKAPGGAGSIWKHLEALAWATGVSGRFANGFRTELHFADIFTHTWMAYLLFHNFYFRQWHLVVQVVFRAEVLPILLEVRWFHCASSVSADSLLCHFGMEGSCPYDIYKPLPAVILSQPSPWYAQETQLLAFSLLRLRCEVS